MIIFTGILAALVLVYVILMVIAMSGFFKKENCKPEVFSPMVSVIVPVKNEEKNIKNLLQSLLQQDYRSYEIIMVNDHSSDNTRARIEEYQKKFPEKIKYISLSEEETGKKNALLAGINSATGEIIFTTDADCIHHSRWISGMIPSFAGDKIKMAGGIVLNKTPDSFFRHVQQLDQLALTSASAGFLKAGVPLMCSGANLAFRRDAFFETGKYDSHIHEKSGDDVFLMYQLANHYGKDALRFVTQKEIIVHTLPADSLFSFFRQRLRWGEKARRFNRFFPVFMAVLTAVIPVFFIAGLLLFAVDHTHFALWSISLGAKAAIDFLLLFLTGRVLGASASLWFFVPAFFFHLLYVPVTGVLAMFAKTMKWK